MQKLVKRMTRYYGDFYKQRAEAGIRNLVSPVGIIRTQIRLRPPAAHRPREQPHEIDRHHIECGAHFERPHHSRFRGRELQICGRDDATDRDRYNAEGSKHIVSKSTASMPNRAMPSSQPAPACRVKSVFAPPVHPACMYRRQAVATEDRASHHTPVLVGGSPFAPSAQPRCGYPIDQSNSA